MLFFRVSSDQPSRYAFNSSQTNSLFFFNAYPIDVFAQTCKFFIFSIINASLTYSFRHHLKLVDDFGQFKKELSEAPSGASRDPQEGGLDALAQVLVCKDIIGWRNESRKIVVFLTDGPYHAAGDGKSAGLFEPYDGQCYTENGTYTKELEMDYPSVGMISKLAAERDIIVIFLVDQLYKTTYDNLKRSVSGSQFATFSRDKTSKLTNDDMIVKLLKRIYEVSETPLQHLQD